MSEYVMGEAGKVSEKVTPMNPDELLNALATIEAFRGDGYRAGQDSLLPLVKELREALADELNKNGLSWERHVHLFARADKALEEEKR